MDFISNKTFNKNESKVKANLSEDYSFLKATVLDGVRFCIQNNSPKFIGFLNEKEQVFVRNVLESSSAKVFGNFGFLFFGGHKTAARSILGVFPKEFTPDINLESIENFEIDKLSNVFAIIPLTFKFRKVKELTHRDFLGSLMALGIERDLIGDILVGEGYSVVFVKKTIAEYIKQHITKVGREGTKIELGFKGNLPKAYNFKEILETVSSPRLDSIVRIVARKSRDVAAGLIKSGQVYVNHVLCEDITYNITEKDIVSVRGIGRFKIDRIGPKTRKNRLFIKILQYV